VIDRRDAAHFTQSLHSAADGRPGFTATYFLRYEGIAGPIVLRLRRMREANS
jgi:hypothetical protein